MEWGCIASRCPTRAHHHFHMAHGHLRIPQDEGPWEVAMAHAAAHPEEMIIKNIENDYIPLEMGIIQNIPVSVVEKILATHAAGPHSDFDILHQMGKVNMDHLITVCRYRGDFELVKYFAIKFPEQLLHKMESAEAGGLCTAFIKSLYRQNDLDERTPHFLRKATIVEKRRQLNASIHVAIKLCMTELTAITPPCDIRNLPALSQAQFFHHVISTFKACGMGRQADDVVALVAGVSEAEAEAKCMLDGDILAFKEFYYDDDDDTDDDDDDDSDNFDSEEERGICKMWCCISLL
jgi:hypothetical protein